MRCDVRWRRRNLQRGEQRIERVGMSSRPGRPFERGGVVAAVVFNGGAVGADVVRPSPPGDLIIKRGGASVVDVALASRFHGVLPLPATTGRGFGLKTLLVARFGGEHLEL